MNYKPPVKKGNKGILIAVLVVVAVLVLALIGTVLFLILSGDKVKKAITEKLEQTGLIAAQDMDWDDEDLDVSEDEDLDVSEDEDWDDLENEAEEEPEFEEDAEEAEIEKQNLPNSPITKEAEEESPYLEEKDEGVHEYELIVADVTWTEAFYECQSRGGHLVRINSDEEYQAILEQIKAEKKEKIKFWLGGRRDSEDSYEYRWVYGDWSYGNEVLNADSKYAGYWLDGEPSFTDDSVGVTETCLNMFYVNKSKRWIWNDVPDDVIAVAEFYSGSVGYICEYE